MKIEYKEFVITHSFGSNKYDLARTSTVKEGVNKGHKSERPEAYGITLEKCFRIILDKTVEVELKETTITFDKYFETYQKVNEGIKKEVQRLEVSLNQQTETLK